jgi:hypothetical protein
MNTEDLRDALARDAQDQPPAAPGFTAGVERRIRRQRINAALIATPFLVVVLLAAAVLGTRGSRDATIATADSATGTSVPTSVTTAQPVTTTTTAPVTTTAAPTSVATTEAPTTTAPAPTTTAAPPTTAAVAGGACGTVTLAADPNASFDTAPFTCFLKALKAGVPADLVVRVTTPQGGSFTDHLSTGADHVLTATVDGSMTMKLPSFSLGGGGGPASGSSAGSAGGDCGTVSITPTTNGSTDLSKQIDQKAMQCVVAAFMTGSPASLQFVVNGQLGGAITTSIELGADHQVTVTSNGTIKVQLPAEINVPEDLLNSIPPGNMTLSQIPGLSGFGKRCATQTKAITCKPR